jgi:hypothetical protein
VEGGAAALSMARVPQEFENELLGGYAVLKPGRTANKKELANKTISSCSCCDTQQLPCHVPSQFGTPECTPCNIPSHSIAAPFQQFSMPEGSAGGSYRPAPHLPPATRLKYCREAQAGMLAGATPLDSDLKVQGTNDDAQISKL